MENELRYYLGVIKKAMEERDGEESFKPSYLVIATAMPTGELDLAVSTKNIDKKIEELLENYDDDMKLKTNTEIQIRNIMIV